MRKQAKMMKARKEDTSQLSERLRSSKLSICWLKLDPRSIAGGARKLSYRIYLPVRARLVYIGTVPNDQFVIDRGASERVSE